MAVGGRSKKPRLSALSVAHKARYCLTNNEPLITAFVIKGYFYIL